MGEPFVPRSHAPRRGDTRLLFSLSRAPLSPSLSPLPTHPSGAWALFYIAEAFAVTAVLNRFPDDTAAAVSRAGRKK